MLDFGPNSTPDNGIYTGPAAQLAEQVPAGAVGLALAGDPAGEDDYDGTIE